MVTKKSVLVLLAGLILATPMYAQKFTKKAQERQAAREANYFFGSSFTFTAGYLHSWMNASKMTLSNPAFGESAAVKNTHDSFNIGFIWDHSFSRQWGMQSGLYYVQKGGEQMSYYDGGLGYGNILCGTESLKMEAIELQVMARYFFPLTRYSRLSVNVGPYLSKLINTPDNFSEWDLGVMCGIGYDWKHLAVALNYQPGINRNLIEDCNTSMNAVSLNVGFRFWKK